MTKDEVLRIMKLIVENGLTTQANSSRQVSYNDQRSLINGIFSAVEYSKRSILLRLVVIDSLYSTNAAYSYFSFEEMADRISSLGSQRSANDYFYQVVKKREDAINLFDERYGIQKDLREGARQMSLLSKYAYYSLQQDRERYPLGFPIYDKLAKHMYPIVCKRLGIKPCESLVSSDIPIRDYIRALDQLRRELFGNSTALFCGFQQFDVLDAYLWRMGKFDGGNMSLLLNREDYCKFIKNIGLDNTSHKQPLDSKDFNTKVERLLMSEDNPFGGISCQKYMDELLAHWRRLSEKKKV